jgi:hypothetical protein
MKISFRKKEEPTMSARERVREQITEIAQRPDHARFGEIDRVLRAIGCAEPRKTKHGWIYIIPGAMPLMLNEYNNGEDRVPRCCVVDFLACMIQIGQYD